MRFLQEVQRALRCLFGKHCEEEVSVHEAVKTLHRIGGAEESERVHVYTYNCRRCRRKLREEVKLICGSCRADYMPDDKGLHK